MSHTYTAHRIASLLAAIRNCRASGNSEWEARHGKALYEILCEAPRGSGIDSGISLDSKKSTSEKLVFLVPYRHMDEHGYYDGWTDYKVTVRASLVHELDIRIRGRDRNGTRDYLADVIGQWLYTEIDANAFAKRQGAAA